MVDQAQLLYLNAFKILDERRQSRKISLMEIEAYTRLFHVDDITLFVRVIQELDNTIQGLRSNDNKDEHTN